MNENTLYSKTPNKEFNQSIVIEDLAQRYKNDKNNKNTINAIKRGMCYMLSIEWLITLLENNHLSPEDVFPDMGSYEIDGEEYHYSSADLAYFMQIADNFYAYSAGFDLSKYGCSEHPSAEAFTYLSDKHYVEACTRNNFTVCNTEYFSFEASNHSLKSEIKSLSDKKGLLISIYICAKDNHESFAHELAIWQNNNIYYFFDPNFGIYEFNDLNNIFFEMKEVYEHLYKRNTNKELSEIERVIFVVSQVCTN